MAKVRVYELARALNLESKALVTKLQEMGIKVAGHQSTIDPADADRVRREISGATAPKKKVVIRRRKKTKGEEGADEMQAADAQAESDTPETSEEAPTPTIEASQPAASDESAPIESEGAEEQSETSIVAAKLEPSPPKEIATPKTLEEIKAKKRKAMLSKSTATIVKKADPSEITEQTDAKGHSVSREDSRGTRITGMSFPGMGEAPQDGVGGLAIGRRKFEGKRPEEGEEEDEKAKAARPTQKSRRKSFSTRDLLSATDGEEILDRYTRKTVYTPTGTRKKDLKRRKDLKSTVITTPRAAYRVVKMEAESISVKDLAAQMSIKAAEIMKKLMGLGIMATINADIDADTATLIATEFGYEVKNVQVTIEDILKTKPLEEYDESELKPRSPIVTVMGHVDHGKTSILDAIREEDVASGEAGGITQHIGAYTVTKDGKRIAFLDTPGHEAFSNMRSRGAKITDIVVLVVAADDGVMPQTEEAISHARDAGVPIIVAVNKMDKPNINIDRIYTELANHGIQSEEWGGESQFVKVSALKRTGLDELLEAINLQAEMLELRAVPTTHVEGAVIEAHLDKGRGPVATIMVQNGTLKVGDYVVAGTTYGRIRAMFDHHGHNKEEAGPATPVEIIGLSEVPVAGDQVNYVDSEKSAREAVDWRKDLASASSKTSAASSLDDLLSKIQAAETIDIPFIVKADTQGSAEALSESIIKLNNNDRNIVNSVIHKAVGGVTSSDIALAKASGAIIIGFNVRASKQIEDEAEKNGVILDFYTIIYEVVDAVKSIMRGALPPERHEEILGHAEVRDRISVPKIGIIAGSSVMDGKITRNSQLRLIRDNVILYDGKVGSLRRFKDDVKEVQSGYECGISIEGYNDIQIGDVIEAYVIEESPADFELNS